MKPATNTPAFRILLSVSVVWALGVGAINYGQYNAITPANARLINDQDAQRCSDPPLIGTKAVGDVMNCLNTAQARLEIDVDRERMDAAISGLQRTFVPPIVILLINAYWLAITKAAVVLGRGGKSLSAAYIRWVRGGVDDSH